MKCQDYHIIWSQSTVSFISQTIWCSARKKDLRGKITRLLSPTSKKKQYDYERLVSSNQVTDFVEHNLFVHWSGHSTASKTQVRIL